MNHIVERVRHIVSLLSSEQYESLEALSNGVRLNAENMRRVMFQSVTGRIFNETTPWCSAWA